MQTARISLCFFDGMRRGSVLYVVFYHISSVCVCMCDLFIISYFPSHWNIFAMNIKHNYDYVITYPKEKRLTKIQQRGAKENLELIIF